MARNRQKCARRGPGAGQKPLLGRTSFDSGGEQSNPDLSEVSPDSGVATYDEDSSNDQDHPQTGEVKLAATEQRVKVRKPLPSSGVDSKGHPK